MKKVLKWILIVLASCVGLLVTLVVVFYFLLAANSARTPDAIARKAGLHLPAYRITRSDDNMERTTSPWSHYSFEIEFEKPLSDSYLEKVAKNNNCECEGRLYRIEDKNPDEWYCLIILYPDESRATLEYSFWDYFFPVDIE